MFPLPIWRANFGQIGHLGRISDQVLVQPIVDLVAAVGGFAPLLHEVCELWSESGRVVESYR